MKKRIEKDTIIYEPETGFDKVFIKNSAQAIYFLSIGVVRAWDNGSRMEAPINNGQKIDNFMLFRGLTVTVNEG